jgi:chemosensory pili system protein ChpA (sensor histidine kinase/response regulator)
MITSRSTEKHRQQAIAAGVNHYVTKPFNEEELLGCVQSLCRPDN